MSILQRNFRNSTKPFSLFKIWTTNNSANRNEHLLPDTGSVFHLLQHLAIKLNNLGIWMLKLELYYWLSLAVKYWMCLHHNSLICKIGTKLFTDWSNLCYFFSSGQLWLGNSLGLAKIPIDNMMTVCKLLCSYIRVCACVSSQSLSVRLFETPQTAA